MHRDVATDVCVCTAPISGSNLVLVAVYTHRLVCARMCTYTHSPSSILLLGAVYTHTHPSQHPCVVLCCVRVCAGTNLQIETILVS